MAIQDLQHQSIESAKRTGNFYYTEIAARVLTDNRDFVIQLTIQHNPNTREMIIDAVFIPGHTSEKGCDKGNLFESPMDREAGEFWLTASGLLHRT